MRACAISWFLQSRSKSKGFILVELVMAVLLAGMLLALTTSCVQRSFASITRLESTIRLQEGRRHLLMQLEKTLDYDTVALAVENEAKISCQTINGNKRLVLYCEKGVLYQKTTTGEGSGINPLSLEETRLTNWRVTAVAPNKLRLSFRLTSGQSSLDVAQLLYCHNARIENGA